MKSNSIISLSLLTSIIILTTIPKVCNSFIAISTSASSSSRKLKRFESLLLHMANKKNKKNSVRARQERDLEDMMGDNWRVFRAKLVAHEQEEVSSSSDSDSTARSLSFESKEEIKHGRLANFFASIFSQSQETQDFCNKKEKRNNNHISSIFNGDNIGGAGGSNANKNIEDPFATDDEKVAVNPRTVTFDRHRWAHPISHVETGCVLVANEKLGGVFRQTVVLIVNHDDHSGSTGVCINRPLPGNLLKVGSETASNIDLSLKMAFNTASVSYGGPVMQSDYSILHGYGEVQGSKKVAPGIFIGGSKELMGCVRRNDFNPSDALFIKGHAAWIPSQLNREVAKGVWYIASVSPDFIFRYARDKPNYDDVDVDVNVMGDNNNNHLWSDILTCMGDKYAEIGRKFVNKDGKRMMP